jgi:hypothetical protein
MSLSDNLNNRKWLVSRLRAEIVGPDPADNGQIFGLGDSIKAIPWDEFRLPKKQLNGEEVVWQDPPAKRYGAGILYPLGVLDEIEQMRAQDEALQSSDVSQDAVQASTDDRTDSSSTDARGATDESEDYGVTLANAFKPSALGVSFLADLSVLKNGFVLEVVNISRLNSDELQEIPAATYRKMTVLVGDQGAQHPKSIWLRSPLLGDDGRYPHLEFSTEELLSAKNPIRKKFSVENAELEAVAVVRGGYSRLTQHQRLITVSLVNRKKADSTRLDDQCLFQSGIRIRGVDDSPWIAPYPEAGVSGKEEDKPLSDERVNRLLYRQHQTFAIGHGSAADWRDDASGMACEVWTDTLPAFETPSTSADLFVSREDGTRRPLKISMRKLAGLDPADDGNSEIEDLVRAYGDWIKSLKGPRAGVAPILGGMHETANGLIERCETCLERIRDGITFLKEDSESARIAREAFKLANHAMLIAQLRPREIREPKLTTEGRIEWTPRLADPDATIPHPKHGYWRAFQIAFLLMSLRGIAEPKSDAREIVDLIWFPTGGGKTEAYLGLTAFTILFNRISGSKLGGADVIMRYTLRLLTAQQFQRAAVLFCALEHLRKRDTSLGNKSFNIGLWVGGSSSPNTRKDALFALEQLQRDPQSENPFILLKCPWCGAKFGPSSNESSDRQSRGRRAGSGRPSTAGIPSVLGYQRYAKANDQPATVVFRCNDGACEFGTASTLQASRAPLPIVIVDEDLLESPPSLVIGTVDKFAMLAWKPEARRLFGVGNDGRHSGLPPSLIIQDELHLISGPLGSMVGAYETVIERLCRKDGLGNIKPKIIASTATISRANDQIRHLYARDQVFLFPPSGLEAGDSFFAREDRNEDGSLKPGRLYVGVLAPAHGSLQTTEARVFACLAQYAAIMKTDDAGRDPWWTLLCFFNSLRELGSAASLFVSDTRDYLRVILDRHGVKYELIRKLFEVTELTSRIRSDQVPKELERLERIFASTSEERGNHGNGSVDACLASNIIEVGVDISRLSLMAIVGQPKTTSQYIQVSSRIGRDPEKPGLAVVLYGQSKPRDRSHYENFRPYHQKLYAQVEPTSVTPFSPPAVDRALHGLIVAAVRQLGKVGGEASSSSPFPLNDHTPLRELVDEMIDDRVSMIAPEERNEVMKKLQRRLDEWRVWNPPEYGGFGAVPQDPPLIHPAGGSEPPAWNGRSWATLSSLRNVDASCEAEVTSFFNEFREEQQ